MLDITSLRYILKNYKLYCLIYIQEVTIKTVVPRVPGKKSPRRLYIF